MKKCCLSKISAVIITKNAQRYLSRVLKSLNNLVDEVIVVDSGSSDDTLKIAKTYKARIIKQSWLGFGQQKNFGIKHAKYNWILSLDADEIVSKNLAQDIKNADFNKFAGFYLQRKNLFTGKWIRHCGWYPDWQLRLFKKDRMRFDTVDVHEQVQPKGKVGHLKGDIIHYTYDSDKQYFQKINNYTDLEASYLYKQKRKWSVIYQIGKPLKEFYEMYFVKKGIFDGFMGLKICMYSSYYRYLSAKKLHKLYKHHENRH
jgi:glycosyltransferase involved in cell wall biosynthesis